MHIQNNTLNVTANQGESWKHFPYLSVSNYFETVFCCC